MTESTEHAGVELVEPPCMLCGSERFQTLAQGVTDVVFRKPGAFGLQVCAACGLVMTRPRPVDLAPYYEEAYGADGLGDLKRRFAAREDTVVRQRLAVIGDHVDAVPETRILDVGCGDGGLLMHARRRWGCTTTGIDFDAAALEHAFEPEACTYLAGTLEAQELATEHFDVVLFLESLEHVTDPVATLREARERLAPGGTVVVEVPNYDGALRPWFGRFWVPYLIPQHTVHFTGATLRAAFEKAGLEVRETRYMNFPLEGLMSGIVAYAHATNLPPLEEPPRPRVVVDLVVFLAMAMLFVVVELPLQWILARRGRSGHFTVVGVKPPDS